MPENDYLKWLSSTASNWWNDSAVLTSMDEAIANGAGGVTTNPPLVRRTLYDHPDFWRPYLASIDPKLTGLERAEEIIRRVTVEIAAKFQPMFEASGGKCGFVCAQVDPRRPGDADFMVEMAKRLAAWAPNIAVKIPATGAGIDAIEECAALGLTTVGTISFTVAQAVEIARRQTLGMKRAQANDIAPGCSFSVVMVGRQDDYIREIAADCRANVSEDDIRCAGVAVMKRAYGIVKNEGYTSQMMPAAMRGTYHVKAFSGADMSISMTTNFQDALAAERPPFTEHIGDPVDNAVIDRLMAIPDFARAYEEGGLKPSEFITYGLTQRTLSQFVEGGWLPVEEFK